MADNIALIKLEVQVADGQLKIDKLQSKLKGLTKGSEDYNLTLKRIQIAESNLSNVQSKKISLQSNLEQSTKSLTKTQVQAKNATGAYTSSALELGRVISDAPYGIRGMANNLTQLISQMGFAAKTAGGLGAAFRGLWTALMGPLGVVLAFTTVISALDFFFGANQKAEKSTDDLTDSIQDFADVLSKNANASIKEYLKLMKEKEQLDKDLKKAADEIEEVEERLAKATERRIVHENNLKDAVHNRDLIQKQLNQASEHELKVQSELEAIYTNAAKAVNEYRENKEELSNFEEEGFEGSLTHLKELLSQQKKYREEVSTTKEAYDSISFVIDEIEKKIEAIEGKRKNKKKKDKPKADIIQDLYGIDTSDKARQDYLNKLTEFFDFSDIDFNKQFEERLKLLDLSEQLGLITSEQYEQYRKDLDKEFSQHHVVTGIAPELDFTLSEGTRKGIEEYNKSVTDEIIRQTKLEEYDEYAKQLQKVLGSINDFLDSEFERQLTMEQNKTNVLNNELHQRLLNEKLSKDERKAIQNEIAQNDEKLRIKQQAIEKKKFEQQKAFNIAMATIDTFRAATGVLADTAGGSIARIIGMTAVISAGLLQVAAISRQKF